MSAAPPPPPLRRTEGGLLNFQGIDPPRADIFTSRTLPPPMWTSLPKDPMAAVVTALNRPVQRNEIKLTTPHALDQEVARQLSRLPKPAPEAERIKFVNAGLDFDDAADSEEEYTDYETEEEVHYASDDAAGHHIPSHSKVYKVTKRERLPKYMPRGGEKPEADPADVADDSYIPTIAERGRVVYKNLPDADKKLWKSAQAEYTRIVAVAKAAGAPAGRASEEVVKLRVQLALDTVKAARAAKGIATARHTIAKRAAARTRAAAEGFAAAAAKVRAGTGAPRFKGGASGARPGGVSA